MTRFFQNFYLTVLKLQRTVYTEEMGLFFRRWKVFSIIGNRGIGGKAAIARAVYGKVGCHFSYSFITHVSVASEKHAMVFLRELLSRRLMGETKTWVSMEEWRTLWSWWCSSIVPVWIFSFRSELVSCWK